MELLQQVRDELPLSMVLGENWGGDLTKENATFSKQTKYRVRQSLATVTEVQIKEMLYFCLLISSLSPSGIKYLS